MRVLARDVAQYATSDSPQPIMLQGWIHRIRELGGVSFIILRDRSGLVQLVVEGKTDYTLESVIQVEGLPTRNDKAPGGVEVRVQHSTLLSRAEPDLPFQVNGDVTKMGLDTILDKRVLSLRNPRIRAIFKVQATIIEAFSEYLRSQDFTEIKSSKLIGSGTEGGTGLFEVNYFDKKVYLAQSPQFYKQTMVAAGLERVFEVAPAYRAEKHDTPRHLNEYVSMDVEMAFITSELDLIELERGLLAHIFEQVARKNGPELELWNARVPDPNLVFKAPLIAHDDALALAFTEAQQHNQALLEDEKASAKLGFFEVTPAVERLLCAWAGREYGIELVFVNQFPRKHRPFYTYPLDATKTMSFDALFRGLEITTGGRRQEQYQALLEVLPRFGLTEEGLRDYLAIFKYGCPPHGGFAIGCERLTQKILGLANVKEASLFPRDRKRVSP
ncbi:aspartate--tRNA(Asn) ligase [Treponema sp. J25]|uniref:aspartate--tRNA(Asn) ligase n=1 Tax=Treponema sp. J25 TaxID=2094121 RepID=UPI0010430155|nr:aspartate--tRNA(Asn) ligase [Treponema sp. J25]TCW62498.1 aspartate--tRNA(Asn) ligase [Treponema sp. J25]HOM23845.1 aspartate--tRNA(Asn) ligase [Termitinemataceae bacterium]